MTPAPPYLARLLSVVAAGRVPPGTVAHAFILHSPTCPFPTGQGPCDCEPDVKIVTPEPEGDHVPPEPCCLCGLPLTHQDPPLAHAACTVAENERIAADVEAQG